MTAKVQSILSYLGILWLVAFFMGNDQRNDLSTYHLRQGLGLLILAILFHTIAGIIVSIIPSIAFLLSITAIIFLIWMVLGIIAAANEVKKPLPFIGKYFEDKFDFIDYK